MGTVIDLRRWRRGRTSPDGDAGPPESSVRLERAVRRLDDLTAPAMGGGSPLEPEVETELLAIIGELSVGLMEEACRRAERLAERLSHPGEGVRPHA